MGTIYCPGGHSFSDGEIPSPVSYRLIPDTDVEALVSGVVKDVRSGGDVETVVTFKILSAGFAAYACPKCGRLLVFRNGLNSPAESYRPE
jgi:hypothetical protein